MENKSVFRKEALARISSPEQMEDYMQVASPRLWMLLSAIIEQGKYEELIAQNGVFADLVARQRLDTGS